MVGNALTLADIDIAAPFCQVDRAKFPFREFPPHYDKLAANCFGLCRSYLI